MTSNRWKALGACAALIIAFSVGLYTGVAQHVANTVSAQTSVTLDLDGSAPPSGVDLSELWKAWSLLQENYVPTHASSTVPTQQQQLYGAISGLTASYGDPYTVFFPPADATEFEQDIAGAFGGVGMEVDNDANGNVVVIAPLKDSPAEKAGILSGDIVLAIDATSTQGMTSDEAVQLIRGPVGSAVKLTIQRSGQTKPLVISIVRDTINIPVLTTTSVPTVST